MLLGPSPLVLTVMIHCPNDCIVIKAIRVCYDFQYARDRVHRNVLTPSGVQRYTSIVSDGLVMLLLHTSPRAANHIMQSSDTDAGIACPGRRFRLPIPPLSIGQSPLSLCYEAELAILAELISSAKARHLARSLIEAMFILLYARAHTGTGRYSGSPRT
jgi:hypothetical protein